MKKVTLLIMASLMVGLGALSQAAVTHTIINKSDHPIYGVTYYRGRVDNWLVKSCRPDEGVILPGESLTSRAGGCLLEFVQIQDGNKIIKLKVANASATIAKYVGVGAAFALVALAIIADSGSGHPIYIFPSSSGPSMVSESNELVVYAGISTVWEYDGVSLVPKIGVKAWGRHDFARSN